MLGTLNKNDRRLPTWTELLPYTLANQTKMESLAPKSCTTKLQVMVDLTSREIRGSRRREEGERGERHSLILRRKGTWGNVVPPSHCSAHKADILC